MVVGVAQRRLHGVGRALVAERSSCVQNAPSESAKELVAPSGARGFASRSQTMIV